uniref:Transmembrane protein 44 n=1 Tax=Gasterosteus aculeatus aculeatus TaxID=481459 RepID=A0AAQ4R8G3_GASAC
MDTRGRRLTLEGPPRGNPLTFPFGLAEFCVDAVTTCFSQNSEKRCIPIGLSFLSMLVLLLSCFLFVYQRCTFRGEASGGTISLYGFLGDLCSTIGAILSRQERIGRSIDNQTHEVCVCVSVRLFSISGRRLRMMKGRRRQHLLAVCVLMVVARGFWKSRASHLPAVRPPLDRRRLLFATLQDNTEVLGYVLGLLSCVIACTSRFPALCRAVSNTVLLFQNSYRGLVLTRANMFSRLLCSLSGALYAAAVLLCDTRVGFLLRVMPWLLSATGCVTIDLLVSFYGERADQEKLNPWSYWQLNMCIVLVLQMCLKEGVEARCLSQTVRVIRVDSFCSSDTSCDSSLVDSDLEVGWSPV